MRRDRVTFAMMLGIPVLLLILFGYAINTDPKQLDAALLAMGRDPYSRAIAAALEVSNYYRFIERPNTIAEAEDLVASGDVAFVVVIPSDFGMRVERGDKPELLVDRRRHRSRGGERRARFARRRGAARAAARAGPRGGGRRSAGRRADDHCPSPLQSSWRVAVQRRARPARRHSADDDGDDDLDRADPRARARHNGEPAGDAGQRARDHARQGAALFRRRRGAGGGDPRVRRGCCSRFLSSAR